MSDDDAERDIEGDFWEAIDDSPFVMLGLRGAMDTESRPMTAQIRDRGIWFFGSTDDDLVGAVKGPTPAFATYASKGHDLFGSIRGRLVPETDRDVIDRLWSPEVAAWYKDGRDDPSVALVRFDMDKADLWRAPSPSLLKAAYHRLVGDDPAAEASKDNRAEIEL